MKQSTTLHRASKSLLNKVFAALAALSIAMVPLPANAHAQLVLSNPKVSATLYKSPTSITLSFDDDLIVLEGSNIIQVIDPKSKQIQLGKSVAQGATLQVKLKNSTLLGRYKVLWRALSSDGHPVSGTYYYYLAKRK